MQSPELSDYNSFSDDMVKTLAFQARYSKIKKDKEDEFVIHKTGAVEVLDILIEYEILHNKSKKLIGWVKIADTNIVICTDESFYQEHQTFQFDMIYEKGTYQVVCVFQA